MRAKQNINFILFSVLGPIWGAWDAPHPLILPPGGFKQAHLWEIHLEWHSGREHDGAQAVIVYGNVTTPDAAICYSLYLNNLVEI